VAVLSWLTWPGEPALGQVLAEREPVGPAVGAVVLALDELVDEPFGVPLDRAAGMPLPALLPGGRVDPFVDHRIVLVPFLTT
jgi:hypothetical protein